MCQPLLSWNFLQLAAAFVRDRTIQCAILTGIVLLKEKRLTWQILDAKQWHTTRIFKPLQNPEYRATAEVMNIKDVTIPSRNQFYRQFIFIPVFKRIEIVRAYSSFKHIPCVCVHSSAFQPCGLGLSLFHSPIFSPRLWLLRQLVVPMAGKYGPWSNDSRWEDTNISTVEQTRAQLQNTF